MIQKKCEKNVENPPKCTPKCKKNASLGINRSERVELTIISESDTIIYSKNVFLYFLFLIIWHLKITPRPEKVIDDGKPLSVCAEAECAVFPEI